MEALFAGREGAGVPMSGESFQRRVALLRDSWAERRQLKGVASVHDFESQFSLLRTLHAWAEQATEDIRGVYGDELVVSLTPAPSREGPGPGFSVTVGDSYTVAFVLGESARAGGGRRWAIAVTVSSGGPGGGIAAAGPERRNGQWTRTRLEDLLLSVLGAWERAVSEGARGAALGDLRARGA